jgi:hypothetical protein
MRKAGIKAGDKARKFLSDHGIGLAAKFAVGLLAWLFSEFFTPSTVPFWVAVACVLLSLVLFWYRRHLVATGIIVVLLAYMAALALNAKYVLATDQQHIRLRTAEGTSYLEIPANSYLFALLPSDAFHQKVISLISCGGFTVAKLPLLPYAPIRGENAPFHSPLPFRRLPMLSHNILGAYLETKIGKSDANEAIGVAFGFSANDSSQISLTDLFPRTFTCTENSVPLIPIIEILPWHPDQSAYLISAVSRVLSFRAAYLGGQVTLESIRALDMEFIESDYKSLLDFISNSLIFRMLKGNLFAEARADIQDRICVIAESNPVAFSGPFASMKEQMYHELARSSGRKYKLAYPACHIDDSAFAKIESEIAELRSEPSWTTAMLECEGTKTSDELRLCIEEKRTHQPNKRNCEVTLCDGSLNGRISDETAMRFFEKRFSEYVVSEGQLVPIERLDGVPCPKTNDKAEDLYMLIWRERRALSILNQPYECLSDDWNQRYLRHKASRTKTLQCARQKGLPVNITDADSDDVFDSLYKVKCVTLPVDALKADLLKMIESYKGIDDFVRAMHDYASWIGEVRTQEILEATTVVANLMQSVCGDREPDRCVAEYGDPKMFARWQETIDKYIGPLSESSDKDAKLKAIFQAISRRNNTLINIAICDLLADHSISERLGISREEYCRSRGLSRYLAVADRYAGKSLERSFQLPEGSTETIETDEVRKIPPSNLSESYRRSWMRKFIPAQR